MPNGSTKWRSRTEEGTTFEELLGIDYDYEPIDNDERFRDDYEAYAEFEWECRTGR